MPGGNRTQLGNELFAQILYLPSVTVPNVAANATASQTVTVPGVLLGDLVGWNQQGNITGLSIDNIYVSANNTLTFYWSNTTVAAINSSPAQPFLIEISRPENVGQTLASSGLPNQIV